MSRLSKNEIRQRYGLAPDAKVHRADGGANGRVRLVPDSFTLVTVQSSLDSGAWERSVSVAGTTIALEVRGTSVGEGSPVTALLRDARNRIIGSGEGAMYRGRATVMIDIDRQASSREPDGILAAADIRLPELGVDAVSPPLLVLPFARLVETEWKQARAVEGEIVALSVRIDGTPGGVERLCRERATVAVYVRSDDGAQLLGEPVATFQLAPQAGRVQGEWTATLALDRWTPPTQAQLDALARASGADVGAPPYRYAWPSLVFKVILAGLAAESGPLAVDDWTELSHRDGNAPAAGVPYTLTLADGTTRQGTLDGDGRAREDGLPPGPVVVSYEVEDTQPPAPSAPPSVSS